MPSPANQWNDMPKHLPAKRTLDPRGIAPPPVILDAKAPVSDERSMP